MTADHECEQAEIIQTLASVQASLRADYENSQQEFGAIVTELAKLNVATGQSKKDSHESLQISKIIRDKILDIDARVGTAPSEISGNKGSGLTGIVLRMSKEVNATASAEQKVIDKQQDSLSDIERLQDESEITKIQSRTDLIQRARDSEQSEKNAITELREVLKEKQQTQAEAEKQFRQRVTQILIYLVAGASGGGTVSEIIKALLP